MISINIDKAKVIAHRIRRETRAQEFAPLDELIAKQIPGTSGQDVEAQRQAIRDKYQTIHQEIDIATSVDELKEKLISFGGCK